MDQKIFCYIVMKARGYGYARRVYLAKEVLVIGVAFGVIFLMSASYFRTKAGAEVDFVVEDGRRRIPLEVKWTENPTRSDARHILDFLAEQRGRASHGYVLCRCPRPRRIAENVTALPWHSFG